MLRRKEAFQASSGRNECNNKSELGGNLGGKRKNVSGIKGINGRENHIIIEKLKKRFQLNDEQAKMYLKNMYKKKAGCHVLYDIPLLTIYSINSTRAAAPITPALFPNSAHLTGGMNALSPLKQAERIYSFNGSVSTAP